MIHLHNHSEYSLLDGLGKPEQYVARAKELGMPAIAVTDHGDIDGAIRWQKACGRAGIKSIIGAEMYIVPDFKKKEKKEKRGHVTLLVRNAVGWQALLKMLTISNLEGFYYRPRIDYQTLWDNMNNGLVLMTGCASSFLLLPGGERLLCDLLDDGVKNCYLEVMPHQMDDQYRVNKLCQLLSTKLNLSLVATNDCHYPLKDQWKAQEVLLAVQRKAKWNDADRWKFGIDGLHLRTSAEMAEEFEKQGVLTKRQYVLAMSNSYKIAEMCWDFKIERKAPNLPVTRYEKEKPDVSSIQLLQNLCQKGRPELQKTAAWEFSYWERLQKEIDLIKRKDFARYFLIVYEIVQFCKENEIPVGPGRGSAGGSLVAYLLEITQVDPLVHGLLFERFISDDRVDFPDIDLDFDRNRVWMVRKHLEEEYGEYNVAGISTFMAMKSKAAVRDVGRVFDLPAKDVDSFAKAIKPGEHDVDIIASAAKETEEGKSFARKYPEQFALACELEGQIRGCGQHPAGLIISGQDLRESDRCNLCLREGSKVVNWDMQDCDYAGLMKIDVLKLSTLSVLDECKRLVGGDFKFEDLTLDDPSVFEILSKGETAGIFQLSGYACKKLCADVKIDSFNDIVAVLALARPGPLSSGMTEKYVKRKHGEKWEPLHPVYEKITAETYGVIVYQEQMMRAMTDLAGLSGNDADRIRKVIGKKRVASEFEPYRISFLEGCKEKKTLNKKQAEAFWQGLLEWAHYGFVKCLTGDTLLTRSSYNQYTGKEVAIKDLYLAWNQDTPAGAKYRLQGLDAMQMCDDGRCRPGNIIGVFFQGKKPVFEIVTQTGKKIKATCNHRIYTYEGYKEVSELKIGDRIAVMQGVRQNSIAERKGQKWRKTNTKGKCGFQKGEDNPAYIDGRDLCFKNSKKIVFERAQGKCEKCKAESNTVKYHYAHIISPVDEFGGNYEKYHSPENVLYLCVSCHSFLDYKKGERKKRYSTGYPVYYDQIVSIEQKGIEEVFDIEMEGPNHNFIANGIVSHNSHAVEYAMIAYWTAFVKTHYLEEFICASLTYGEEKEKEDLIKDAQSAGLQVITPKIGISAANKWVNKNKMLFMPFTEIKGVGESQAEKCAKMVKTEEKRTGGFFDLKTSSPTDRKDALSTLLIEIKAFDEDLFSKPDNCASYFQFNIGDNFKPPVAKILKKKAFIDKTAEKCNLCALRSQAQRVVLSDSGIYNALILAEAPGRVEDEKGQGLVGDSGDLLWTELKRHGVFRRMLHVGNICKCFPKNTKTPTKQEADKCFSKWGLAEIKSMNCNLILGLGGTVYYALTGKDKGITKVSGQVEWVDKVDAWVVWCVHPSFVLRSNSADNQELFKEGIRVFAESFKR